MKKIPIGRPSKWIKLILSSFALTALVFAATPAPASAAPPPQCPFTNALCLFEGSNFTGAQINFSSFTPGCVNLAAHGWGGGRVKSAINTASKTAVLWSTTNCSFGGPFQYIFPNQQTGVGLSANSVLIQ